MKTIQWIAITLCAAFAFTACKNRAQLSSATIAGTYQLVKVDGKAIPARVNHGSTPIQVVSGEMEFDDDRACTSLTVFGPVGGENIVRKVTATYASNGNNVDLKWHGAGRTRGTFKHNSFTMNNEGMIFYYEKLPSVKTPTNRE